MSTITAAAPQLLVDDLARSLAFYETVLGFTQSFHHEGHSAGLARDGIAIRLKAAGKMPSGRSQERAPEHLDAYLFVTGIGALYSELEARGAPIVKPLETQHWGMLDFHVRDPDGYRLCFSEVTPSA